MRRTKSLHELTETLDSTTIEFVWKDESHYTSNPSKKIFIDLIGGWKRNFTKVKHKPIMANRLFWYIRLKLPEIRNNISAVYLIGKPRKVFVNQIEMRDAIRTFISESDIIMHEHSNSLARKFYYNMTIQMIAEASWRLGTITEVREYTLNFKCRYDVSLIKKFNTIISIIRLREEGKLIGWEGSGKLPE